MTPKEYLSIRTVCDLALTQFEKYERAAFAEAKKCPLPHRFRLRPAFDTDMYVGSILWSKRHDEDARKFCIVEQVGFKYFIDTEGCSYEFKDYFVEIE